MGVLPSGASVSGGRPVNGATCSAPRRAVPSACCACCGCGCCGARADRAVVAAEAAGSSTASANSSPGNDAFPAAGADESPGLLLLLVVVVVVVGVASDSNGRRRLLLLPLPLAWPPAAAKASRRAARDWGETVVGPDAFAAVLAPSVGSVVGGW